MQAPAATSPRIMAFIALISPVIPFATAPSVQQTRQVEKLKSQAEVNSRAKSLCINSAMF